MIRFAPLAALVLAFFGPSASATVIYRPFVPAAEAAPALPAGKRVPAGWPAFAVGNEAVQLRFAAADGFAFDGTAWLRLTTALDDRATRHVEVRIADAAATLLGQFDLRFAHALETFQIPVPAPYAAAVARHGVTLRLLGNGPALWFLGGPAGAAPVPPPVEFLPHAMAAAPGTDRLVEFRRRFGSLASLQTFGWMEGCVLDGLHDLAAAPAGAPFRAAADEHWRIFLPDGRRLVYEDPRSTPADGRIYGIEGALPFADLARRDPAHPLLDLFLGFARRHTRPDGAIQDGTTLSAEGSYTVAYPLAVAAARRRDPELARLALRQLELRADRLWADGAVWLRRTDADRRTFRGWARGVAWHALGVARSLAPLRNAGADTTAPERELVRIDGWVRPLQRRDGLWSCFVEDGERGLPDTSGSAGIAAALALGARLGVLPAGAADAAVLAVAGTRAYLTPDGLLEGAAQSNRGGEELQRSDYRVISQMGMGLFAQLLAAVEPTEDAPAPAGDPGSAPGR